MTRLNRYQSLLPTRMCFILMRVQCNVNDFYEIDFEPPTNSSEEADIYHLIISTDLQHSEIHALTLPFLRLKMDRFQWPFGS